MVTNVQILHLIHALKRFRFCAIKRKQKTGFKEMLQTIQGLIKTSLCEPLDTFLQKLFRKSNRSSKGRRKIDRQIIFEAIS